LATQTPVDQTWTSIKSKVEESLKTHFPLEGRLQKIVLNNIVINDAEASHNDIRSQEQAKHLNRTWGTPVYGDISLFDKTTGKEVDRAKVKLFTLPRPTERYSFIVDGSERQIDNLWRLRSGIYAHEKQNGQFEAEFNLAKAFARDPRLYIPFDPETKRFKLRYGATNISLYSVLKVLGVQDEDMKKMWGDQIYQANVGKNNEKKILEFYRKLNTKGGVKAKSESYEDKAAAVVQAFHAAELQPDTTKVVLGKPIDHVNGEALLLASERILKVSRGDIPQDDRDSLVFKDLHSVDDFIKEQLTQYQTKRKVQQKIGNNIDRMGKVREIVTGDLFGGPLHEFFTRAAISRNAEQTNPLTMMSDHRSTTIIAPKYGGITDDQKVTSHMKLINPSHLGFLDPIHTPESERTGITLHLPLGVKKEGNQAKTAVYDMETGKMTYVTPAELHSEFIILPDQVTWEGGKPKPVSSSVKMKDPKSHEIVENPFKQGRYLFLSAHQLFDEATNLIPFLQNNQGNRTMTASRQATQAVSLHEREQPLVQVQSAGTQHTWEKVFGTPWSITAHVDGAVSEIKYNKQNGHADAITIKDAKGVKHEIQVYNHFPLNDPKSFLHSTVKVDVGANVKKGDVLADSNYTRNGHLALGTNLRISYLPYKGYNFEDGIVISESAAKKLSSEHVHRMSLDIDPESDSISKAKFQAFASTTAKKLTHDQANKLGDDGVIKVGQRVDPGDILIAAVGKRNLAAEAARAIGRLDKKLFQYQDKSVLWESQHPGEVVNVIKNPNGKGVTVHVKTIEPAEIGDKIVGRHGNKGIITRILADAEMPKIGDPEGAHVEVLMNPSGVPTRINLGQMLETAAAKIAKKSGKPYIVQNFGGSHIDYTQQVREDLKNNNLSDTEEIFDPATGKKLGDALTGHQYIMKLKHQVEKKLSVRSEGPSYSPSDHAPTGTGTERPGQAIGQLEFYALLAHGARANLREMATYKADQQLGDKNDPNAHIEFWNRVRTGQPLPVPRAPFAYKKFEALLTGLGINIHKEGNELVLTPLTDKGVLAISNGEIPDPGRMLRGKDAKELEKGLFDPRITGGLPNDVGKGLQWSHIALAEPLPNPIFVGDPLHPGPAVILSGLSYKDFEEVAKGKHYIDGKTGGTAIAELLKKINVKEELKKSKEQLPNLRGAKLDKENRKTRYLMALDGLGLKPHEAYIMKYLPVLPPIFRPIVPMPDGSLKFDDINHYYKSLGNINNQLKSKTKDLPDETNEDLREQLYDYVKALQGLGGKPVYQSNRAMTGIMEQISGGGDSPKSGYFQRRLMKRRQDLSMRSTIIPEPEMHLDHVGLPKEAALELYKPFVVRELQTFGYNPIEGLKIIKEQTPLAWKALQSAMDKRPVLLKRDPALHKFSIMAFKPKIVEGKAIQIHPLVTAGYNADFDGDTMSAFVPLTDEAVLEAEKMFPSNNLFSSTHGGIMYAPDQESLLGLHLLSKWGKETGKKFNTYSEVQRAYQKNQIHVNDVVDVGGTKTTLGRLMIGQHIPDSIKDDKLAHFLSNPAFELVKYTKGDSKDRVGVHNILEDIAKNDPKRFATAVDRLKDLGNKFSYELGFSFGLKDLKVHKELRQHILSKFDEEAKAVKASKIPQEEKDQKIVDIYTKATSALVKAHEPLFKEEGNRIFTMVDSGARGKMNQFMQMTIAPMLMQDGSGKTIPAPVKKSYSEGLDVGDYWTALHGARKGTLQRVEGTSEPGNLTKEIVNVVIPNIIVSKDCGTQQGVLMNIHDDDIHDRFLAIKTGPYKAGTLIDPKILAEFQRLKIDKVVVRSPLKCKHGHGLCSKCYGLNENGHLHELGTNIGVIAGHALGEPATQLAMDSFHTGGIAASRGGVSESKFDRLNQLLKVPKTLPNAATLSKVSGKVEKVERDVATNGHYVHVSYPMKDPHGAIKSHIEKHYIQAQRKPIAVGETVKKGDPLSDGNIDPRELLEYTDIHNVQNYVTKALYNEIYKDEGVKKRNIETVVRSLTNLTKIDDPGSSNHLPGDVALRTVVEEFNRNVERGEKPIEHTPLLRRTEDVALGQQEDWMARLNFRRLKQTILEGSAKGWRTNLHSMNPISSYAHGAEFGRGTKEKPHLY
jgi:DNA-directed RNA polymerase subunit beta'